MWTYAVKDVVQWGKIIPLKYFKVIFLQCFTLAIVIIISAICENGYYQIGYFRIDYFTNRLFLKSATFESAILQIGQFWNGLFFAIIVIGFFRNRLLSKSATFESAIFEIGYFRKRLLSNRLFSNRLFLKSFWPIW